MWLPGARIRESGRKRWGEAAVMASVFLTAASADGERLGGEAGRNTVGCGGSVVPRLANGDSMAAASVASSKSNCCDNAQTSRRCRSSSKLRRLQRLDGLAKCLLPLRSDRDKRCVVGIEPRLADQVEVVVGVDRQIDRRPHRHVGTHGGIE